MRATGLWLMSSLWCWVSSDVYSNSQQQQQQRGDMRWLSFSSICIYNMCSFVSATYSSCPSTSTCDRAELRLSASYTETGGAGARETTGRTVRETRREASAALNTDSNSRLSHCRMSHRTRHCALNETEWGETPAERGCRVWHRARKHHTVT